MDAAKWVPPIGIPVPDFGLTEEAPPVPVPWDKETPGFYYIERVSGVSSDSRAYGHPGAPRWTIPLKIPAGSVVEIHGPYTQSHVSPNVILAQGTKEAPIFIRGFDSAITRQIHIKGAYFILENLTWKLAPMSDSQPVCFKTVAPADHVVLRHSDLGGILIGGGIMVAWASNILIWDNVIHNTGDVNSTTDQDCHSIAVGSRTSNMWIVDNDISESSGSGLHVSAGSIAEQAGLNHIYAGRNHVHRTRQAGLACKQCTDVIFSQNNIHDVINTSWSPSKGLGFQYAPERIWYLFNEVSNCTFGIYSGSDSGMGNGRSSYMIGNVIHGIHHLGSTYNPNTAWAQAGIMLAGGIDRYVIANTIYDADGGIYCPTTSGKIDIVNNILSNISEPGGSHVFVEMGAVALASAMDNNLFGEQLTRTGEAGTRIKWGNNTTRTLAEFQRLHSKGAACIEGSPGFVSATSANFDLARQSPALYKGVAADVYATFQTLYGINIQVDKDARPRPFGQAWDIGAYEGQYVVDPTDPCSDLRIENEKLKAENDKLKAENESLRTENASLVAEGDKLRAANAELTTQNTELQRRSDAAIRALEGGAVLFTPAEAQA